jgi:tetratricopeptide (TPR) repeat protein
MPEPLWQCADYLKCADHKSPLVREWALDGLEYHYPGQGLPVALKLLGDPEEDVFEKAALYLAEHATEKECPVLLEAFLTGKTKARPAYLKALGRVGYVQATPQLADRLEVSRDQNEIIALSGVLGLLGDSTAREALRGALLRVKKDPLIRSGVAYSLGRLGQMEDLREIVAACLDCYKEASSDRDCRGLADVVGLRGLAASLAGIWAKRVKVQRELLDCAMAYFGPDFPVNWFSSRDMAPFWGEVTGASRLDTLAGAVLDTARQVIRNQRWDENTLLADAAQIGGKNPYRQLAGLRWLLLNCFQQEAPRLDRVPEETAGILLACLFALAADRDCGELPAATPPAEREQRLLKLLCGSRPEVSPVVTDEVVSLGGWVARDLAGALTKELDGSGAKRVIQALCRIARQNPQACLTAAPVLLMVLENDDALDLMDDCVDALAALGPDVLPLIDRAFQDHSRSGARFHLLGVLRRLPYPEAVTIMLKQEKLLFTAVESYCHTAQNLGSADFIDLFRREWHPGEFLTGETLLLLAGLHGQQIPELPDLRREYRQELQRERKSFAAMRQPLEQGALPALSNAGRVLELECRCCGRIYHYPVEHVFVNTGLLGKKSKNKNLRDELLIQDDIVCKGCGTINNYEFTNAAHLAVMGEMMLLTATGAQESDWLSFGRCATFDGKEMLPSKMPSYLARLVGRSPNDAALRIRYGNVLRRYGWGRIDEALEQYRIALQLEPDSSEAAHALGTLYENLGRLKEAVPLLAQGEAYQDAYLKEHSAAAETAASQDLGDDPPGRVTSSPARADKIGRNQPCPCGSGKKYKHCCGKG